MFLRLSPRALWKAFIYSSCPWVGMGAGVWFLLQGRRAITPSLMWRKKCWVWTKITSHPNRGLCGTFLVQKLLSVAILALLQPNIFLAILGYMDISQHRGWCMRRTSDFFFRIFFFLLVEKEWRQMWLRANLEMWLENENSLLWKELDGAAESSIRFFKMRGMEKCGSICLLWKGWNNVLEA